MRPSDIAVELLLIVAERGIRPDLCMVIGVPSNTLRAVVADDNCDLLTSTLFLLQIEGYEVQGAVDGVEALELVVRVHPDIALLDIGMPKMNGHLTARAIRELQLPTQPFVVAITAFGGPEDVQRSAESGFDLHLTKPVDPSIFAALHLFIDGWREEAAEATSVVESLIRSQVDMAWRQLRAIAAGSEKAITYRCSRSLRRARRRLALAQPNCSQVVAAQITELEEAARSADLNQHG
jgi:CheY-like chemotaxis protein